MVFTADAAERQHFYLQQAVRKPQRATVQQHILPMGVLNDSPKDVPKTKKRNIPFGKAYLATIILMSVPMMWQNQYNLTHLVVLKFTHALLLDLEAIK
jgi:hypothetical protein